MKQTNNAIKFLMAQYRAIFKNANIAMVAAMAAAALAAGSANAQTKDGALDASDFANTNDGTGVQAETVNKDSALDMSKVQVDGDAFGYAGNDAVTNVNGAQVTITGAKDKHLAFAGLSLTNGAKLTISNSGEEANSTIYGYKKSTSPKDNGNEGTFTVDGSTVEATSAAFQFNTVDIKNGSTVTLGGKILGDKASNDKLNRADWFIYSNIGTNISGTSGGVLTVKNSTVNLNDESQLVSTTEVALNGATINFDGKMHEKGYSTAFIRGISGSTAGKVTVKGGTTLNATGTNGNGAIYANTIDVQSATLNIGAGKKFILDGDWEDKTVAKADKHVASAITIKDFTVNASGDGKLVIGNATNASTVEITGKTVINSGLENNADVTVSGADAVLAVDAANIESGKGLFAGSTGTLTVSGGTLQLNGLTGEKSLDLAEATSIAFSGSPAQNKVYVNTSGTIKGDNLAISKTIADIGSVTLNVTAKNLALGKSDADSSTLDLGIGAGVLAAENVTFKSSGETIFTLKNNLNLKSEATGTITGPVTIGAASSGAKVSINGGQYTALNNITVTSGSTNVGLSVNDASLTLSGGKLVTTATNGTITLNNGTLDVSKGEIDLKASTVTMAGSSAVVLDGKKVLTLSDTAGNTVDFKGGLLANSISGAASSKLVFNNLTSLNEAQFKELKKETGFKGLFEGFTVTGLTVENEMALGGDGVQSGITGQYDNTQATLDGTKTPIDAAYDVGNVELTSGDSVNISGGSLSLNNGNANGASGNFVQKADGTVAGVTLTGATSALTLNNEGKIGSIAAANANEGALVIGNLDGSKTGNVTVKGNIGETNAIGKVQASDNSNLTVAGSVNAKELTLASGADLKVTANAGSGSVAADTLNVALGATIDAAGQTVTVGSSNGAASINGDVTAGSLVFSGSSNHLIAGNANIDVETLNLAGSGVVQVGDDSATKNGSATVVVDKLIGSGLLFVDPSYQEPASKVIASSLSGTSTPSDTDAGTLQGGAVVGKNAALGIGFASEAELKAVIGTYLDAKGAFTENADASKNQLANALVLDKKVTVADGNGITVSTTATTATTPAPNTVTLESGAGLIITDNAFDKATDGSKTGPAIKFNNNDGKVTADGNSSLVLVGDFTAADKDLVIFADNNGSVAVTGAPKVVAAGGLLVGTLGTNGSIASLALDPVAEKAIRSEVSAPVGQLFIDYAKGEFAGATGAGYDFLATTISAKGYKAIDAAAHAATYAGAQQAAVVSVTTMADAMFGRVGAVGVEAASIAATGSQANGGVWLTPMYKSMDADGFNAEGVSYGSDVDAAGVAFGADTVNGNMRFGAVFNIGSGDAEGKGQGNGLKDEFDYYGFGIYSAMGFGNLALVGDASLTVISHDVEGLGLRGKADTTAVTMGLTGQYTVSTPMVDVTPHLGARFIRLNTDSYDLMGADGAIATTDFDVQNVFSVPLGVTLSKGFTTGGWTLAPSADLTITFNGGDTEAKSSTTFTGIKAINMNTEVLDEVTYGLTLGLGAQYGAFGTSFGINYTGSENTDSFGVNAQCRYMF
ncbi:beta strand repeat-containing protein [Anaerobiospirillum succiniciproducens]|uniref:beta strand repeat-containing protein n=1 Tax=Anaerobiospirillum succiniciproducens TaxID=13335 RepID=UPI003F8C4B0E